MRARAIPNFARRASRESIEPKAVLEHRAPKTFPPILHTRGVESKVGRAVHCAPEPLALAQPTSLNLVFRALTSAATARANLAQRRAGVHARRNNTALNTAASPF